MKKLFAYLTAIAMTAAMFTACSDEGESPETEDRSLSETAAEETIPEDDGKGDLIDTDTASGAKRSRRTKINGNGDDVFTVMVYMCGTDLESDYAAATSDIIEMAEADLNDNVNVVIYTGGTLEWQNDYISSDRNQIWKIENEDLVCIEDDMGVKEMTDPATLTEFVSYCADNFPANRNALILWDHGGGALYGYGSDQIFNGSAMQINEIDSALDDAGVSFDFIGFDACLMATVETAYMINNHADFMIASEETEPGTGWFYTNWLNEICSDPSTPTEDIGRIIIDDFVQESTSYDSSEQCTLSIIDLTEMDNVYNALCDFSAAAKSKLDNSEFSVVSRSRSNTKSFGGDEYDTIDLVHFAQNLDIPESEELISAINAAVVYSGNSEAVNNSNGMTIYFPYNDIYTFDQMMNVYTDIGLKGEYTDFITAFASILAGGQSYSSASASDPFGSGSSDTDDWSDYDWFDSDYSDEYEEYYEESAYDESSLVVEDRGDYYALALSDEDWDIINDIQIQLYYDDGEGYIDLGTDNYYEIDDDGALMVDYDGLWFSLGDYITPLYITESGDGYTQGYIPAYLNDEYVQLVVLWDETHTGDIIGAKRFYDTGISMKGLIPVEDGDVIQLTCDYYNYDGEYDDLYTISEEFEYDSSMKVEYYPSGAGEYQLYYVITDIYNNTYYTEAIYITFTDDYFTENFPEYYDGYSDTYNYEYDDEYIDDYADDYEYDYEYYGDEDYDYDYDLDEYEEEWEW